MEWDLKKCASVQAWGLAETGLEGSAVTMLCLNSRVHPQCIAANSTHVFSHRT